MLLLHWKRIFSSLCSPTEREDGRKRGALRRRVWTGGRRVWRHLIGRATHSQFHFIRSHLLVGALVATPSQTLRPCTRIRCGAYRQFQQPPRRRRNKIKQQQKPHNHSCGPVGRYRLVPGQLCDRSVRDSPARPPSPRAAPLAPLCKGPPSGRPGPRRTACIKQTPPAVGTSNFIKKDEKDTGPLPLGTRIPRRGGGAPL